MKRVSIFCIIALFGILLSGCAVSGRTAYISAAGFPETPVQPPRGGLFTYYSAPLSINFKSASVQSKKQGSASTWFFRDFLLTRLTFAWDKADVDTATSEAGIHTVEYADYEYLQILGIFGKFTVNVHGD